MPDGADVVAATAACVAAGLVAWQSWETRKSARASQEAAEAAVVGLETANVALDVARQEEGHSRVLVAEAQRARIDAALPAISVVPQRAIFWPPLKSRDPYRGDWADCDPEEAWSLPADQGNALGIAGRIHLHNGSEKYVRLLVDYTKSTGGPRVFDEPWILAPAEKRELEFLVWAPIERWAKRETEDEPLFDHTNGRLPSIRYWDHLDSGGSITWEFAITYSPIYESHENQHGRYRLVTAEPSVGRIRPELPVLDLVHEHRSYWLSRKKGLPLKFPGDE